MGLHAENLQEIRNLEIKSAPEIIAYSELGNNADCVLITKIKNSKDKQISKSLLLYCTRFLFLIGE